LNPANLKKRALIAVRRQPERQPQLVVIIHERGGNSAVFNTESEASSFIRARIAKGTLVNADGAASWDNLHERFEMKRINHQEAYSFDGACTNQAEDYFAACGAPRSAFTIISPGRICSAMRRVVMA
jgi:hypothetical protein